MSEFFSEMPLLARTVTIVVVAVVAHVGVWLIRRAGDWLTRSERTQSVRKLRTIISLATSIGVFTLYFLAVGMIMQELGISLTAYLASATVIGLAVGFGSQGVVQDVVTGLTLIFSNLLDVGEMVNIAGQTGVVRSIGMRFVVLENSFGSLVSIPNRTISNVMIYPRGYMRSIVDVSLTGDEEQQQAMAETVESLMPTVAEQYPGIMRSGPSVEGRFATSAGRAYLRIKFRIWPDRGDPVAQSFRQELLHALKKIDPDYADWMVSVYFEVEKPLRRPWRRLPARQATTVRDKP